MLKKAKGIKVTVYDTGIKYNEGGNYLIFMVDDTKKDCYDLWLGASGCGHMTNMFGLMKEYGLEDALETAEANLLDRNCMIDVFNTELEEKELLAELQGIWDYRTGFGCPNCEE